MKKQEEYSNTTKAQARSLILDHFQGLSIGLLKITEFSEEDYKKIVSSIMDRDLLLLEKLGL